MFENNIENLKDEIINKTCELIRIPSVNSPETEKNKPFGEEINNALEYTLSLGKKLGFRTKNLDGYCGYIEFGEGEDLVGIIGHLDVVPAGEGWEHAPFKGIIENGKIYGRGAIDDKGPVIASLYAMKAVMDNAKVNKRVRLILGTNEELEWKDIKYYKSCEELPTIAFSPDADFPCIYAEKGIENIYFKYDYSNYFNDNIIIENIDCNNNAINVVPKFCKVDLKVNDIEINTLTEKIQNFTKKNKFNIEIINKEENRITVISQGISAHASKPQLGVNAISIMLLLLEDIFSQYKINIDIFEFFKEKIGMELNGESLQIDVKDESGELTLNVGDFKLSNNKIVFGINLRVPIYTKLNFIENKFKEHIRNYNNIQMDITSNMDALYVSKETYLVKTLTNIFNKMTNMNEQPLAIGGGTYAKAFKNCVSFGANLPGNEDMCHQVDEYIKIDNLILASKIYAEAIYELAK